MKNLVEIHEIGDEEVAEYAKNYLEPHKDTDLQETACLILLNLYQNNRKTKKLLQNVKNVNENVFGLLIQSLTNFDENGFASAENLIQNSFDEIR